MARRDAHRLYVRDMAKFVMLGNVRYAPRPDVSRPSAIEPKRTLAARSAEGAGMRLTANVLLCPLNRTGNLAEAPASNCHQAPGLPVWRSIRWFPSVGWPKSPKE